jgi:hypothetical protein
MREQLLEFLKALETAIPPPEKCHHAITYAQYGSDEHGWKDKLALQIGHGGKFHCFFIEPGDFEKPAKTLIDEIRSGLMAPADNAQLSDTFGRYLP